jgi:hypothetical protein
VCRSSRVLLYRNKIKACLCISVICLAGRTVFDNFVLYLKVVAGGSGYTNEAVVSSGYRDHFPFCKVDVIISGRINIYIMIRMSSKCKLLLPNLVEWEYLLLEM